MQTRARQSALRLVRLDVGRVEFVSGSVGLKKPRHLRASSSHFCDKGELPRPASFCRVGAMHSPNRVFCRHSPSICAGQAGLGLLGATRRPLGKCVIQPTRGRHVDDLNPRLLMTSSNLLSRQAIEMSTARALDGVARVFERPAISDHFRLKWRHFGRLPHSSYAGR